MAQFVQSSIHRFPSRDHTAIVLFHKLRDQLENILWNNSIPPGDIKQENLSNSQAVDPSLATSLPHYTELMNSIVLALLTCFKSFEKATR